MYRIRYVGVYPPGQLVVNERRRNEQTYKALRPHTEEQFATMQRARSRKNSEKKAMRVIEVAANYEQGSLKNLSQSREVTTPPKGLT